MLAKFAAVNEVNKAIQGKVTLCPGPHMLLIMYHWRKSRVLTFFALKSQQIDPASQAAGGGGYYYFLNNPFTSELHCLTIFYSSRGSG